MLKKIIKSILINFLLETLTLFEIKYVHIHLGSSDRSAVSRSNLKIILNFIV